MFSLCPYLRMTFANKDINEVWACICDITGVTQELSEPDA